MVEMSSQDVTVRTHLFAGGEKAHGAIFVGGVGAFHFEASRDEVLGWSVSLSYAKDDEIPKGLHEPLVSAVLSSIGVAEGLHRHPPPRILSVSLQDLQSKSVEPTVDVRDVFPDEGIAQGFISVPGRGRFTFQADHRQEGEWNIFFGLDFPLPEKVAARLEQIVLPHIVRALEEYGER